MSPTIDSLAIRHRLSEQVRDRLEAMIRDDVFADGELLPSERELMERFGVGRPSIREALFALEQRGLVRLSPGERPRVSRPTPRHFMDTLSGAARMLLDRREGVEHFEQARIFMEEGLARHLARDLPADGLGRIRDALAANATTIGRAKAFAASDVAFHRTLVQLSGNPIFMAMHDAFVEWLISQRTLPDDAEASNRQSHDEHRAIVAAIEARDEAAAGRAMRVHLENAHRKYAP